MSSEPRVLVAGIGNVLFGDDGFGPAVASALLERGAVPPQVTVADFGIRGFDLTYALLDGWEAVVMVDVTRRGGAPGTLYLIEPDTDGVSSPEPATMDMHGMHPARVLSLVRAMGGDLRWIRLVGCEPASLGGAEGMEMKLSPPVAAAVQPAIDMVLEVVEGYLVCGPRAVEGAQGGA